MNVSCRWQSRPAMLVAGRSAAPIKGAIMGNELNGGYRTVDGLQIRYADSDGSASQHLVLTSPWPESLHAFDRIRRWCRECR